MPKANRICKHCGKEYYVCYSCVNINSYKRLFCSADCYKASLKETEKENQKGFRKKENKNVAPVVTEDSFTHSEYLDRIMGENA